MHPVQHSNRSRLAAAALALVVVLPFTAYADDPTPDPAEPHVVGTIDKQTRAPADGR